MTQTLMTFGDSNTFGTPPMENHDFHPRMAMRWPLAMQADFPCTLLEEGLPGRTACQIVATAEDNHLDGLLGLRIALNANGPIDRLIIMLGTNDLQLRFGKTPWAIMAGIAGLLRMAHEPAMQAQHGGFAVTLICPPPILEVGSFVPEFYGAAAASQALAPLLRDLAAQWKIDFIDAGEHISPSPKDGVHFDAAAHETLGRAVAAHLHQLT